MAYEKKNLLLLLFLLKKTKENFKVFGREKALLLESCPVFNIAQNGTRASLSCPACWREMASNQKIKCDWKVNKNNTR